MGAAIPSTACQEERCRDNFLLPTSLIFSPASIKCPFVVPGEKKKVILPKNLSLPPSLPPSCFHIKLRGVASHHATCWAAQGHRPSLYQLCATTT